MVLKLGKVVLCLAAVNLALAQSPYSVQSDSFHVFNCATPCVAEFALTQLPAGRVELYLNGVLLRPGLYQITTPNQATQIIVSFSASAGTIQDSDLIVATYPFAPYIPFNYFGQ